MDSLSPAVPASIVGLDEIVAAARVMGVSGGGRGTAALLALLYDTDVDVGEVLRCLQSEPGLAALVLKVANAAYYRQTRSVGTMDRAIQVLGLSAIRGIAAAGCMDRMSIPALGRGLDAGRFRSHSLAVATAAQTLSQRAGAGVDAEAFMAGLLHDIGIVLLARLRPQAVANVGELSATDAAALLQAETDLIGANHAACGALLADAWSLPAWLGAALQAHHLPRSGALVSGVDALPALLALGDYAAHQAGYGLWPICATVPDPAWAASIGLDETTCSEVAAGLVDSLQRLAPAS